jgi:hypothetical protein
VLYDTIIMFSLSNFIDQMKYEVPMYNETKLISLRDDSYFTKSNIGAESNQSNQLKEKK